MSTVNQGAGAAIVRRFKQYSAYRDSGVEWLGKIPAHWEVKRIKRVFRIINGATPASGEPAYWDGDIKWVTPEDLGDLGDRVIKVSKRNITEAGYRSCGATLVPVGSLVLSTRAPIGHLAVAGVELCTNQGCRSLVIRGKASTDFFFAELLAARPELESLGQGSTFRELAKGLLEDCKIADAPDVERSAIAAFLDRETARIDALVAKKEQLFALLKEQRTGLITRAVTKGLDPNAPMKDSGVAWLGEIPVGWEVKRLKEVASVSLSNVDKKSLEGQEAVRLCNYTDVYYHERITSDLDFMAATATLEQVRRFSLRKDDVLITKDSESWTDIAVPAVVSDDLPEVLCGYHLALIRPKPACHGPFLARAFCAVGPRDQFQVVANGITRFGLGSDAIATGVFAMPPEPEQRRIATFLDRETARIDALVAKIHDAIERLKELRTALIAAAVTGKIDVRGEVA
jgi:type I restriction enzyme, S subunit